MIEELIKGIKAQLYERASSPLLGSFAVSWLIWNYKVPLVLLSSLAVTEKISYIEVTIYGELFQAIFVGLFGPLATALAYVFLYPIPAKHVFEYARKRQRELKEIQAKIDDETPVTKEEAREIRRDALRLVSGIEKTLEGKERTISVLRAEVEELKVRIEESNRGKRVPLRTADPSNDLESTIVLTTPDQHMEKLISLWLRVEPEMAKNKYVVSSRDGVLKVDCIRANASGTIESKTYTFKYEPDAKMSAEFDRIKELVKADFAG